MRRSGLRWTALGVTCAVLAGCVSDGRQLRPPTAPPPVTTTTSPSREFGVPTAGQPTSVPQVTVPSPASSGPHPPIEIDELFSPENAVAEMSGTGAFEGDPITVDGEPVTPIVFRSGTRGQFIFRVSILDEGAHTVCIAEACGRVYTLDVDAESHDDIVAKIDQALPLAREIFDYESVFPSWSVEIGGALAGTGGSTDADAKIVTIYTNRGRTVDDFVRTVLHEFGHVVDAELLDDSKRDAYRVARGIDPALAWEADEVRSIDQWGMLPSEDFAEVMVMIWSDGRWTPRTGSDRLPTPDVLSLVAEMVPPAIV